MRTSRNEYAGQKTSRRLINGYDYENQAWVMAGHYVNCGHPAEMNCGCYGRKHQGEKTKGE